MMSTYALETVLLVFYQGYKRKKRVAIMASCVCALQNNSNRSMGSLYKPPNMQCIVYLGGYAKISMLS